jgi:tRNA A-37 threonylcarbamoyl transferase component Bud32
MEPPSIPEKLGRFEIRGVLGSGAMALVFDGWDPAIGRRAAIKTIRRDQLDSAEADEMVERFKREAQAAGRLSHPNIVSIYEYGEDAGIAYIAMEHITGRELRSYFDRNERFPIPEVARIMTQILGALDAAHKRGVVHRDIKPGNIYVLEDGTVKVSDFGIARMESSNLTQAGMVLGTPPYMSPEQFMGHTLDGRSDLFSAGVILYQFLTGERPFTGNQAGTIMHKVLEMEPPAPSKLNVQVPKAFDGVLAKALAKRPDERYQTAREFADAVNAAASARAAPAAMVSDAMETTRTGPQPTARSSGGTAKGAAVGIGIGAAVGLIVLGGIWLVHKQRNAVPPAPAPVVATEASRPAPPVAANSAPPAAPKDALTPAAAAHKPFDPVEALERVFEARDRDHPVNVVPDKPQVRIGKDRLRFRVSSGKPGYLYVLMVGTDKTHFNLLFPNAIDDKNRLAAGQALDLPRPGWAMTAGGPKGANHFVALVSENPRDFSAAGLRKVDPFGEFPLDAAAKLAAGAGNAPPVFAGTPVCKDGKACSARYGAAIFSVEEVD